MVKVRDLESQEVLFESNKTGPGKNERFEFTVPASAGDKLMTYIVSVEDIDRQEGAYFFAAASGAFMGANLQASPESVVQSVFDAAQSGDFASLEPLCDPKGENDEDTQAICDLATDEKHRESFIEFFSKGRITGDARISPDGTEAEVPFIFGPEEDREEVMKLVNRDGQWYLSSF